MAKITKQIDKRINKLMYAAADVIKESCKTKNKCNGCPFSKPDDLSESGVSCKFDTEPREWELGITK